MVNVEVLDPQATLAGAHKGTRTHEHAPRVNVAPLL